MVQCSSTFFVTRVLFFCGECCRYCRGAIAVSRYNCSDDRHSLSCVGDAIDTMKVAALAQRTAHVLVNVYDAGKIDSLLLHYEKHVVR